MDRSERGGAITEFGAALFVMLIIIFFPTIDLIYMGTGYGTAWYLHHLELREVSLRKPAHAGEAIDQVDRLFLRSAFPKFLKMDDKKVRHDGPHFKPDKQNPESVTLKTVVTLDPFVKIPFFDDVPGVGKEFEFSFYGESHQEEKDSD